MKALQRLTQAAAGCIGPCELEIRVGRLSVKL